MSRADMIVSAGAWEDLLDKVRAEREENDGDALDSGVLGEILRQKIYEVEGEDV